MDTELAFLIPALVDQNFKKAQIFCTSRLLSDLVGKIKAIDEELFIIIQIFHSIMDHKRVEKTQFQCSSLQIERRKFSQGEGKGNKPVQGGVRFKKRLFVKYLY